jgi:crotonobetainyl-CoA:carnitine CoA-transferase CaiB-like acyl-CoA transferase
MNILLALRRRDLTGEGCQIDIAMADAMFTFSWLALAGAHATGRFPGSQDTLLTGGSPRYRLYPTRDGKFLAVGALEEKFWRTFCEAIGLAPELWDDGRDPDATFAAVATIIGSQDAVTWARRIEPLDCCCTVVRSLEEARADPHFVARGLFDTLAAGPDGRTLPAVTIPIAPALRRPASVLREVRAPGADPL